MGDGAMVEFMGGLSIETVWGGLKWVYVLAFSIYVVFAVVVVAQVRQMMSAFYSQGNGLIRTLAWVHLGVAVAALLMAIVIL